MEDQPDALAVVVFLDLFQAVVLHGFVGLLGHLGALRASGPKGSSGAEPGGVQPASPRTCPGTFPAARLRAWAPLMFLNGQ